MSFVEPVLWKHQKEAELKAISLSHFAFLFEPGTGKTLTTIRVLRLRYTQEKRILRTLIVAPVIVLYNWKEEWAKFSKVPSEKVVVLSGSTKDRIKLLEKAIAKHGENIIVVTNYEGLVESMPLRSALMKWGPEAVVIDESQKIKSHNSKRSKVCWDFGDVASYRYILSGTPILNSPADIFSQWRFLDHGETFGRNFFLFRNKYFYDKNAGMPKDKHFPNWQIRSGAQEEISNLMKKYSARAIKSECLDLPPFIRKTINVDLSPDQKRMYDEMKKNFIAYLDENNAVVAELALTKGLRLLQIVTGFCKTDKGDEIQFENNPRNKALKELLEEITPSNKVLVWCVFKENYKQVREICEDLKIEYKEAHGEISDKEKYAAVEAFNKDVKTRVFIGHPGALGIGINLISASYSIYYSRNYSLENDIQSEARNYRGGSNIHTSVTRIDIVAPNTIDALVLNALANKQKISSDMLNQWKDTMKGVSNGSGN